MTDFGGLLSLGGGGLVCTGCGTSYIQWLGGLGTVGRILGESPIARTPFRNTGMMFGGAHTSDGAKLCAFLGVPQPGDELAGDGVSFGIKAGTGSKPQPRTKGKTGKPTSKIASPKSPKGQSGTSDSSAVTEPKRPVSRAEDSCLMRRLMAEGCTEEEAFMAISNAFM